MKRLVAAALLSLVVAGNARAAEDRTFRYDWRIDGAATVAGGLAWGGLVLLEDKLASGSCWWCGSNGLDSGVRDALRWHSTTPANVISYATVATAVAATVGLGASSSMKEGGPGALWVDGLMVAEAVVAAGLANQMAKVIAERQRPYAHAQGLTTGPVDSRLSFYSSHTSVAFSFAVAGGTIASMRGYRTAPWIWAIGLSTAAATAYLRIAADKHYFTDVMTGAVLGSAFGLAIPWLHYKRPGLLPQNVSLAFSPRGLVLGGSF